MSYVVVRIRGRVDVRKDIQQTLSYLNLRKKFNATIVPGNDVMDGMLRKAKDFITWGSATPELVRRLLTSRGKIEGGHPLTEQHLLEITGAPNEADVFEDIAEGRRTLNEIEGLKPTMRLSPPRGGFKGSTKRDVGLAGELGRRDDIGSLVDRML